MTTTDYTTAANTFIDAVTSEVDNARRLTSILRDIDGTLAEWREENPAEAAEADRLAEALGFDIPNTDDCGWQAYSEFQDFLTETAGYGAEVTRKVTVTLAGGGPSGWIDFTLDNEDRLLEASVSYCDWWQTPVTTVLSYDDAMAAYDRYRVDILMDTL